MCSVMWSILATAVLVMVHTQSTGSNTQGSPTSGIVTFPNSNHPCIGFVGYVSLKGAELDLSEQPKSSGKCRFQDGGNTFLSMAWRWGQIVIFFRTSGGTTPYASVRQIQVILEGNDAVYHWNDDGGTSPLTVSLNGMLHCNRTIELDLSPYKAPSPASPPSTTLPPTTTSTSAAVSDPTNSSPVTDEVLENVPNEISPTADSVLNADQPTTEIGANSTGGSNSPEPINSPHEAPALTRSRREVRASIPNKIILDEVTMVIFSDQTAAEKPPIQVDFCRAKPDLSVVLISVGVVGAVLITSGVVMALRVLTC